MSLFTISSCYFWTLLPVKLAPATPKSDPTIAEPPTVPIAPKIAEEPKTLASPEPIRGAANPPVKPIRTPPPTDANPIIAKRLVLETRLRRAASACSCLIFLKKH